MGENPPEAFLLLGTLLPGPQCGSQYPLNKIPQSTSLIRHIPSADASKRPPYPCYPPVMFQISI